MKKSRKKSVRKEVVPTPVQIGVNVGEVMVDAGAEFRELLARGGMAIAAAMFAEEITRLCGPRCARGEGLASRWG